MSIQIERFSANPIISPSEVKPSKEGFEVMCVLNPGVFEFKGKTMLLARIAEMPIQSEGTVSIPYMENGALHAFDVDASDPELDVSDPREYSYRGKGYLSSISHLKFFESEDGQSFVPSDLPSIWGQGQGESFGVEDCRVNPMVDEDRFILTYTAVSPDGYSIGAKLTQDFESYDTIGNLFPIPNKDGCIFPKQINEQYISINRPTGAIVGGCDIWMSSSPDLVHWGKHYCLIRRRAGMWDSHRIGINGPPIECQEGYLIFYHGVDGGHQYCMGAALLDKADPTVVLSRSEEPLMKPVEAYEKEGFFGGVVFSCGQIVKGDDITMYYGAADTVICGCKFSLRDVLKSLKPIS